MRIWIAAPLLIGLLLAGCGRTDAPIDAPPAEPATQAPAPTAEPATPAAEPVTPPELDALAVLRAEGSLVCPATIAGAELTAQAEANADWVGAEASCTYGPVWSEAPEQANLRFDIVLTATRLETARAAAAGQEAEDVGSGARKLLSRRVETVRIGAEDRAAEVIVLEDVEAAPAWMPFTRTRLALWVVDLDDGQALSIAADYADTAETQTTAAVSALLAAQAQQTPAQ